MHSPGSAKTLGLLIHDVGRLLRNRIDQRAQALGLTSAQWRVLSQVARCEYLKQEAPKQAALAEVVDMEPITLSRHIDRLEAAGLIERRADPDDRRAHRLFMTEQARPVVADFRALAADVMKDATAGISEAEIASLTDTLERIS